MSLGKTAVAFKSRIVHCPWELEGTSDSTDRFLPLLPFRDDLVHDRMQILNFGGGWSAICLIIGMHDGLGNHL